MPYSPTIVQAYHDAGLSNKAIADRLGCHISSVGRILTRREKDASKVGALKIGRPAKIVPHLERRVVRDARKCRRQPLAASASSNGIHENTARKILRKNGMQKRRAVKKPYLNDTHRKTRLQWCKDRRNWGVSQWERVLWSDEACVKVGENSEVCWVFRNASEKFHSDCLQPVFKSDRQSIMVWGCFRANQRGELLCFDKGGIDSQVYTEVLRRGVLPIIEEEEGLLENLIGPRNLIFQQDNAPIHKSKKTADFLRSVNVSSMPWPPNSPDLNPIENIWVRMKREFYRRWVYAKSISRTKLSRELLKQLLQESWEAIESEYFGLLVASMPRRVADVIKARGGH